MRPSFWIMALAGVSTASAAAAQPAPIIVTGHGLPSSIGDNAYDLKIITRERLTGSASDRLEDVLRDAAGFHQFRRSDSRSAHPTSQGASLRGLGGNASSRALVLLDGVPVADPFGGWIDWSSLDPRRLGYVRVTRGGGAGPFGSGALAGTIELASAARGDLPLLSGGIAYGSRDSLIADAALSGDVGAGYVTISGRFDRGDGFIPVVEEGRGSADRPADYRQWSTRARAIVPVGDDTELQASAGAFGDDRERGVASTDNSTRGADASLRILGRGSWAWEALAYLQSREFSSRFASVSDDRSTANLVLDQHNVPATGYGAKLELRPPVGDSTEIRLGLDYRESVGRTNELYFFVGGLPTRARRAGGRNVTIGGFVEGSHALADGLVLTGGARIDRWQIKNGGIREWTLATGDSSRGESFADRSHWEPTGRAAIAWQPANALTLRAAGYFSYRLPTLNELYRPFRVGADTTVANAALRPERLAGVEAGVEFQPLSTVRLGATLFWNQLDNAIANVTLDDDPEGSLRQRQNLDAIRARGLEIDASFSHGPWSFAASYAYADSRVRASGAALALDGLRPAQTPRHQGSATVGWLEEGGLTASVTGRYVSSQFEDDVNVRRLDDALTFDAALAVPLAAGIRVEARAENLTDRRVEAGISGAGLIERATPRTLWLAIRYTGS